MQNAEIFEESNCVFEPNKKFQFEEDVRNSLSLRESEFNEFSTVAFCQKCSKEVVTVVSYEKVKGENCEDLAQWILCWAFPACMAKNKRLIHQCPLCRVVLAQTLC